MTLDHDILLTHLEDVQIGSIADGTAIGNAVASAVNRLKDSEAKTKLMILLTDGAGNVSMTNLPPQEEAHRIADQIKDPQCAKPLLNPPRA